MANSSVGEWMDAQDEQERDTIAIDIAGSMFFTKDVMLGSADSLQALILVLWMFQTSSKSYSRI
jgi:hypothetical protein